jgi:hypothetical protein
VAALVVQTMQAFPQIGLVQMVDQAAAAMVDQQQVDHQLAGKVLRVVLAVLTLEIMQVQAVVVKLQ